MDAAFIIVNHYGHKDHVQTKAFYALCRLYTLYHHNKEHLNVYFHEIVLYERNIFKYLKQAFGMLVQMYYTAEDLSEKLAHQISCYHIFNMWRMTCSCSLLKHCMDNSPVYDL